MPKLKTLAQFIQDARKVHSCKYDYSLAEYINDNKKIKIICPNHGIFEQKPSNHLQSNGCPDCGGRKKMTAQSFIQKAKGVHGCCYGYELVKYKNNKTPITIVCPIHGMFEQTPSKHLSGKGCYLCGRNSTATKLRMDKKEFAQKCAEVHDGQYSYDLSDYLDGKSRIKVICPVHGVFTQQARYHLSGRGCKLCSANGFDTSSPATLYFLRFNKDQAIFWKVGITNRTIKKRFLGDSQYIEVSFCWDFLIGQDAIEIEKSVLSEFSAHKLNEEYVPLASGKTECFSPSISINDVVSHIKTAIKTKGYKGVD